MGFWFRVRVGPVGYTARMRRKPQSYRAYRESRKRRERYAARYEREKERRGTALSPSEKLMLIAAVAVSALVSPLVLLGYLIRQFLRAIRWSPPAPADVGDVCSAPAPEGGEDELPTASGVVDDLPNTVRAPERVVVAASAESKVEASRPPGWTIKGRTSSEFDGRTLPTLREWLKFWLDERRSAGRAEEMTREDPERFAGRTRDDHIRMIEAEIVARGYSV
jgi:hypothetical protein